MTDFEKYIQRYLDLIPTENWIAEMRAASDKTLEFYNNLTDSQANFAYAPEKWSLKTLLEHLTDTEKIFHYRALRFARKDATELAGFNEEQYARNSSSHIQPLSVLTEEFSINRQSSVLFFQKLSPEQLQCKGKANGNEISVATLGKLIVGHNIHHLHIIKERYLPALEITGNGTF